MLKIFKRRPRPAQLTDRPGAHGLDNFEISDLLEHPALQAVMVNSDEVDAPTSLEWARLAAGGPIHFDQPTRLDAVA
jgi:hypothetical protein